MHSAEMSLHCENASLPLGGEASDACSGEGGRAKHSTPLEHSEAEHSFVKNVSSPMVSLELTVGLQEGVNSKDKQCKVKESSEAEEVSPGDRFGISFEQRGMESITLSRKIAELSVQSVSDAEEYAVYHPTEVEGAGKQLMCVTGVSNHCGHVPFVNLEEEQVESFTECLGVRTSLVSTVSERKRLCDEVELSCVCRPDPLAALCLNGQRRQDIDVNRTRDGSIQSQGTTRCKRNNETLVDVVRKTTKEENEAGSVSSTGQSTATDDNGSDQATKGQPSFGPSSEVAGGGGRAKHSTSSGSEDGEKVTHLKVIELENIPFIMVNDVSKYTGKVKPFSGSELQDFSTFLRSFEDNCKFEDEMTPEKKLAYFLMLLGEEARDRADEAMRNEPTISLEDLIKHLKYRYENPMYRWRYIDQLRAIKRDHGESVNDFYSRVSNQVNTEAQQSRQNERDGFNRVNQLLNEDEVNNVRCFYCNRIGHIASGCLTKKADKKSQKMQQSANKNDSAVDQGTIQGQTLSADEAEKWKQIEERFTRTVDNLQEQLRACQRRNEELLAAQGFSVSERQVLMLHEPESKDELAQKTIDAPGIQNEDTSSFIVAQVPIRANGYLCSALIDTGACISVASSEAATLLGLFNLEPSKSTSALGLGGSSVQMKGSHIVTFQIGSLDICQRVHFTDGPCSPGRADSYLFILGNDVLSRLPRFFIDYGHKEFHFGEDVLPLGKGNRVLSKPDTIHEVNEEANSTMLTVIKPLDSDALATTSEDSLPTETELEEAHKYVMSNNLLTSTPQKIASSSTIMPPEVRQQSGKPAVNLNQSTRQKGSSPRKNKSGADQVKDGKGQTKNKDGNPCRRNNHQETNGAKTKPNEDKSTKTMTRPEGTIKKSQAQPKLKVKEPTRQFRKSSRQNVSSSEVSSQRQTNSQAGAISKTRRQPSSSQGEKHNSRNEAHQLSARKRQPTCSMGAKKNDPKGATTGKFLKHFHWHRESSSSESKRYNPDEVNRDDDEGHKSNGVKRDDDEGHKSNGLKRDDDEGHKPYRVNKSQSTRTAHRSHEDADQTWSKKMMLDTSCMESTIPIQCDKSINSQKLPKYKSTVLGSQMSIQPRVIIHGRSTETEIRRRQVHSNTEEVQQAVARSNLVAMKMITADQDRGIQPSQGNIGVANRCQPAEVYQC
ncbi:unnamed protein product [Caenorhabditis nigoni]